MPAPPASRPDGLRTVARLGVAALAGLLLGLALISGGGRDATRTERPLRLYGRLVPTKEDAAAVALGWVTQRFGGWFNLDLPDGERRVFSYGALGVAPDRQRLRQIVRTAESGVYPPAIGLAESAAAADGVDLIVPVRIDRERLRDALLGLKYELDRSAVDARLDLDHEAVTAERPGRLLDIDRSANAIERAFERGAEGATLVFEVAPPRRLAHELSQVRHDALLGSFETRHDAAHRRDPSFNLQLAASKLDGYVLMPSGVLDFNAVVGPQDEAHGYRIGREPTDNELVDSMGEGMSQISSTLHAAALFAGLDVVERHPLAHPSSYIELGLDSAVAFPSLNLRLKNPYDFPVVLRESVADGRVRAEVRGERRPHAITLIRKIDAALPFERLERPDDLLPRGVRRVAQRGVPGIRLRRYRIRRDGAHAVREVMIDERAPVAELTLVGTGANSSDGLVAPQTNRATFFADAPDIGRPPREYLTDELLVMTQDSQPDGPLVEQRIPGRFAVPGWTKDIGAPAWISTP